MSDVRVGQRRLSVPKIPGTTFEEAQVKESTEGGARWTVVVGGRVHRLLTATVQRRWPVVMIEPEAKAPAQDFDPLAKTRFVISNPGNDDRQDRHSAIAEVDAARTALPVLMASHHNMQRLNCRIDGHYETDWRRCPQCLAMLEPKP
jgi:hypothetical protein